MTLNPQSLKRKTPMKRSGKLRPVSAKTAKVNRKMEPERREYLQGRRCVLWRAGGPLFDHESHHVHEIHGGSNRQTTKLDKRYWLAVHRLAHDELQNMPKPKQWALKVLFDPENFDPAALSDLPGVHVDPLEVLMAVAELRKEIQ